MAGHWIEWEKGLVRKPEVIRIARMMGVTVLHAAAACMLVWEWAEDVSENGMIPGVTPSDVSLAAGVPGIGEAMVSAGWLIEIDDAIVLPNWNRHNSEPAKKRALKALYMRVYRSEKRSQELRSRNGGVTGE